MTNYASNSHKSKEAAEKSKVPEKFDKVTTARTSTREKTGARKMLEDFIVNDFNSVKSYAIHEIILPSVKRGLYDLFTGSLNMLFFGNGGSRDFGNRGTGVSYRTSYDRYYSSNQPLRNQNPQSRRIGSGFSFNDIEFENRGDAQVVLERMDEIIERYGVISVAGMYDLAGITAESTYHKYGWTDIRSARIVNDRGVYIIDMPRALPLD